jgi:fermentation-respiration switch protein FrsA (DUF1100 family)
VPSGFVAIPLQSADGRLVAWYRPAAAGRPTLVFFNGNAGTLAGAASITEPLSQGHYGLLLVSYPGYDGNPGRPTEQGLYRAGRAALAWLGDQGIGTPVIMGWSLGTGVAVQMAAEHANSGLVLLAPFTSMVSMAARHWPFLPVRFLLRDRFDNVSKLARLQAPFLLIEQGDADSVIPISEGQALFAAAAEPKRLIILRNVGHVLPLEPVVAALDSGFAASAK